jgi:hypothetical protein
VPILTSMAQSEGASSSKDPAGSFVMSKNSKTEEAITGAGFAFSMRSMPLAWTLDVPRLGADRNFAIKEVICRTGQTSLPATIVGRMLDGSSDEGFVRKRISREELNRSSLERYFRAGNAPNAVKDHRNLFKLQQNGAPSERSSSAFSLKVPLQCLGRRPCLVEILSHFVRHRIFDEFNPDEPFAIDITGCAPTSLAARSARTMSA